MKIFFNFIFIIFLFFHNSLKAEIFYIDLDKIVNESKPGKYINNKIDNLKKINEEKIIKIKDEIKKRENDLISQKNILSEKDFNKKLNDLKSDINELNIQNQQRVKDQQSKFITYKSNLIKQIEPILLEYVSKNNIKYLLQKKYIIVGHNDLNKTEEIINLVNQKVDTSKLDD